MRTHCFSLVAAFVTAIFVANVATAAPPNAAENRAPEATAPQVTQVTHLIGATVSNLQGKELGRIKDILLDSKTGSASFAIIDEEIAGAGHGMLVVPYQALRVSAVTGANRHAVALDLRSENLHVAPSIHDNNLRVLQNPQFLEQARNFYGPAAYAVARPIENATLPPCPTAAEPDTGWTQDLIDFYNQ
jgi:sporulation protein YlmC with PRC-barrel domain